MKNLLKSLAEFQKNLPTLKKGTRAYNYSYTAFDDILSTCKPLLLKCGLIVLQPIKSSVNGNIIVTQVYHIESGEVLESEMTIPQVELVTISKFNKAFGKNVETTLYYGFDSMNLAQVTGSYITYFRRYAYCSLLGFTSDEDTDANGTMAQPTEQRAKPQPPKQLAAKPIKTLSINDTVKQKVKLVSTDKARWDKGVAYAKDNKLEGLLTYFELSENDLQKMKDAIK